MYAQCTVRTRVSSSSFNKRGISVSVPILLLSVLCVFLATDIADESSATVVASDTFGSDLTWELDDQGTLTISGSGPMPNYNMLTDETPWKAYKGAISAVVISEGITKVGDYTFRDYDKINTVSIADTVTSIGTHSFGRCYGIHEIIMPASIDAVASNSFPAFDNIKGITRISLTAGNGTAFDYKNSTFDNTCTKTPYYFSRESLEEVIISDGVTKVGNYTFFKCSSLKTVSLGSTVTTIGDYAFYDCSKLGSISLSSITNTIGNYAFSGCKSLRTMELPDSVVSLGEYAFNGCGNLEALTIPYSLDAVVSDSHPAFWGCVGLQKVEFTFGTGVAVDYALEGSTPGNSCLSTPWSLSKANLTEISLPQDILRIGNNMFYGCNRIGSVTIPDTVTSIGQSSFAYCGGITSLTMPVSIDAVVSNSYPAFKGCEGITSIEFTKGAGSWFEYQTGTLSSGTHYHFTPWYYSKGTLSSVTFDTGILSIGDRAFEDCGLITSVSLPNTVQTIGMNTFRGCSITTLILPDSVTSIGASAFKDCARMTELTLPISLNAVAANSAPAFFGCVNICKVTFTLGSGVWSTYAQNNSLTGMDCYLYTPWYLSRDTVSDIAIESGVTSVPENHFKGLAALSKVVLPDSMISLGNLSFFGCSALSDIEFAEGLSAIGDNAFEGCTSLTDLDLPSTLTSIGACTFKNCSGLTSLDIPDATTDVGTDAFSGCSLRQVSTGNGMTSLAAFSFDGALEEFVMGTAVTEIGEGEFRGCGKLVTVIIPSSVTVIGKNAFSGCTSLENITVAGGSSFVSDGGVLFNHDRSKLIAYPNQLSAAAFVMPDTVTEIESGTICNRNLTDITMSKNLGAGYVLEMRYGTVVVSDTDAAALAGIGLHLILDVGADVPDRVKKLAGVFDCYTIDIGSGTELSDGLDITLNTDSRSKSRSVYQLYEDGRYSRIDSANSYGQSGADYQFNLKQSAYVSIMSRNDSLPYDSEICFGLIVAGLVIGSVYALVMRRRV